MTDLAAAAALAGCMCLHMAKLGSQAALPEEQAAVGDHPAADACADRQIEQMAGASSGTIAQLAEGSQIGVVPDRDRAAEALAQAVTQRHIDQPGQVGRVEHQAAIWIQRTGRPDADPFGARPRREHRLDRLDDPVEDRVRAALARGGELVLRRRRRFGMGIKRGASARPAEVNGYHRRHARSIAYPLAVPPSRI